MKSAEHSQTSYRFLFTAGLLETTRRLPRRTTGVRALAGGWPDVSCRYPRQLRNARAMNTRSTVWTNRTPAPEDLLEHLKMNVLKARSRSVFVFMRRSRKTARGTLRTRGHVLRGLRRPVQSGERVLPWSRASADGGNLDLNPARSCSYSLRRSFSLAARTKNGCAATITRSVFRQWKPCVPGFTGAPRASCAPR